MYAARRTYVKQWDHQQPEERCSVLVTRGGEPATDIRPERIGYVEEEVMYWRKANHIHNWFVENVQDGVDNCATYYVSSDHLSELLDACERVIEASELVDGEVYMGTVYDQAHPKGKVLTQPGRVIKDPNVAKALLPTQSGFFFGSEEYDEDYLGNVVATRDWIVRTLEELGDGARADIVYHSSW
ncbi:MAG TPA: hypothetical protein VMG08_16180 [Allosphingosinicella sp.]|nr:hypothetical protein [Allosphingosinicella sp.]